MSDQKNLESKLLEMRDILTDAESRKLCTRRDANPVWDIKLIGGGCLLIFVSRRLFRQLDEISKFMNEILQRAIEAEENTYLDYNEDPAKYALPGKWEKVGDITWNVPRDADASELERKFLYYGNWDFYISPTPGRPLDVNPFSATPDELLNAMRKNSVKLLISSFPDDLKWVIAIDLTPE